MVKIAQEFKQFALRGNVVDMAVGIVIGTAFGKIVTALVNDVVMPPIGLLIANKRFANLKVTLREAAGDLPAVTLNYGSFIQTILDFVIIAFAIFLVVKAMNSMKRKEEAAPAPAAPPREQVLLEEIRDILKQK